MKSSYRLVQWITNFLAYAVLILFAYIMLFPFLYMLATSLKYQTDTFRYPPRLIPMEPVSVQMEGYDEPLPLYNVTLDDGTEKQYALVESSIKIGVYAEPNSPEVTYQLPLSQSRPTGGATNQATVEVNGKAEKLFDIEVDGQKLQVIKVGQTALGRFVDPANPQESVLRNVRLTPAVENPTLRPENYSEVIDLQGLDRSLINTALVTILVVIGQLITSVLGGYALARLRFPGRDQLFVVYLGTIMIPFVVLITPLYQLMVAIGWVNRMAALVIPWIFTAYGTFLMRQFFITIPKEIEEAALIDGASRLEILMRIFLPASVPALATLATFTFLYAWNSFFWPLVIINTGNRANHVLTLSLSILRGRASDNANLVMAGAAIAILPPVIIYMLAQRFFVESAVSSGVKG
ncbi:MAG: carbohydrate ABC transporter permease [Anaerolineales bacterium]|nr:carbohydrate ABC transporter permease [Anaerolineales bacterium]